MGRQSTTICFREMNNPFETLIRERLNDFLKQLERPEGDRQPVYIQRIGMGPKSTVKVVAFKCRKGLYLGRVWGGCAYGWRSVIILESEDEAVRWYSQYCPDPVKHISEIIESL